MDQALAAAERIKVPTLVLYGANERLIPRKAQAALFQRLPADHRIVIYPVGHHTLLRDLEAARVHDEVIKWIREGPRKARADLAFRHACNCLRTTWKGCPPCRDHRPGA